MNTADYLAQYLEIRGVEAALLFSTDGLPIDTAARDDWQIDHETFVAVAAQVTTVCHELGALIEDTLQSVALEYGQWTLVLQMLPEVSACVCLLASAGTNLGLLRVRSRGLRQGLLARLGDGA